MDAFLRHAKVKIKVWVNNVELKDALLLHANMYPRMRPADAVKLVYQNEFGGGHMIKSPEAALIRLRNEYAATEHDAMQPLMIPIGSGMARVQLKALKESGIAGLNEAFVETANTSEGTLAEFLEKLDVLLHLTLQGVFAFQAAELEKYLSEYKKKGYPAVSHSEEYREAYLPAYRVVKESIFREKFK